MKNSFKKGLGFGVTSGIITTLGLIIGLYAGTASRIAILGGIITIAIADSFSDSLGIHLSEEAVGKKTKSIWESMGFTFLFKLIFAGIFVIPFLFFNLEFAVILSLIWGFLVLGIFSFFIAKQNKTNALRGILEHLGIAILVVAITYYVGTIIGIIF